MKQERSINIITAAAVPGIIFMASAQLMIMLFAPVERQMGIIQKIFYLHLPMAWWGMFSFFLVFICSVMYLYKRNLFWDHLSEAAAELGLVLAALALITGSIWARISWNTWWTWDPRLTTTLIMWFIYAAYLIVRRMDFSQERRGVVSAVIGIVAFLDVPLVFFSARLWPQTIHPTVKSSGMDPMMGLTVLFCVFAFGFFWAAMLTARFALGRMESRLDAQQKEMTLNG